MAALGDRPSEKNGLRAAAEAALASEGDPRRRAMLNCMVAHLKAADEKDVEARLATLAEGFRYDIWADGENIGAASKAEVGAFYRRIFAAQSQTAAVEVDTFIVTDDAVVADGLERLSYSGEFAAQNGAAQARPGETWVSEFRICTIWRFDGQDQRIASVTVYPSPPPTLRRRWRRHEP
jgi:hypothetical protein